MVYADQPNHDFCDFFCRDEPTKGRKGNKTIVASLFLHQRHQTRGSDGPAAPGGRLHFRVEGGREGRQRELQKKKEGAHRSQPITMTRHACLVLADG